MPHASAVQVVRCLAISYSQATLQHDACYAYFLQACGITQITQTKQTDVILSLPAE